MPPVVAPSNVTSTTAIRNPDIRLTVQLISMALSQCGICATAMHRGSPLTVETSVAMVMTSAGCPSCVRLLARQPLGLPAFTVPRSVSGLPGLRVACRVSQHPEIGGVWPCSLPAATQPPPSPGSRSGPAAVTRRPSPPVTARNQPGCAPERGVLADMDVVLDPRCHLATALVAKRRGDRISIPASSARNSITPLVQRRPRRSRRLGDAQPTHACRKLRATYSLA